MTARGQFITLEGIEGAGKSTHLETIRRLLAAQHHDVLVTREPGGTETAERIRAILLDRRGVMDPETELLLMFAARAEHLKVRIQPALNQGTWVVCDRFTDSTYAYQGGGRGFPMERIAALENHVQGAFRPDLTILFDVDVQTGLARAGNRGQADRFERESVAFFERVRKTFLDRAAQEPVRIRVVDASQPVETVEAALAGVLSRFCRQHDA
jgi:dTMP kinase